MLSELLPSPELYDDWKSYARALGAALESLANQSASGGEITYVISNTPIDPDNMPPMPTGFVPLWLNSVDAALYMGNAAFDPPTAPNIVFIDTANIADAAIENNKLAVDAVNATNILNGAVGSLELADVAVTKAKVAVNAVGSANIIDLAVVNAKIGVAAVLTANIQDAAVINAKIADATILNAKLVDATITGAKIANATIVTALIADAQIVEAKIGDLAVNTGKIANAAITSAKIANLAVGVAHIIDLSVSTAKIAALAVTAAKIAAATITNAQIANATILTANIGLLQVTSALIANAAIGNAQIANLAVASGQIQDLAVTSAKIGNLQVGTTKIANDAITTAKIQAGTIIASHFLLDNGVDLGSIVTGALNTSISASQGADVRLPVTASAQNVTVTVLSIGPIHIAGSGDTLFVQANVQVVQSTPAGNLTFEYSLDGSTWTANPLEFGQMFVTGGAVVTTGMKYWPPVASGDSPTVGDWNSVITATIPIAPGQNWYFRIRANQFASGAGGYAALVGDSTKDYLLRNGFISLRRFFSK